MRSKAYHIEVQMKIYMPVILFAKNNYSPTKINAP